MSALVLSDFSKTWTKSSCPTTFSLWVNTGLLPLEYVAERDGFYAEHRQHEADGNIEQTVIWWKKHLGLFPKYTLTHDLIRRAVQTPGMCELRDGADALLAATRMKGIPIDIVTSGPALEVMVEAFTPERIAANPHVHLYGNQLCYDEHGNVIGYNTDRVYCPLNKDIHPIDLSSYDRIILLGDDAVDGRMTRNHPNVTALDFGRVQHDFGGIPLVDYHYLGPTASLAEVIPYL